MKEELRNKIIAFNIARAKDKEAAADLYTLMGALPNGIAKNLLKDEACGAILEKYGITGE